MACAAIGKADKHGNHIRRHSLESLFSNNSKKKKKRGKIEEVFNRENLHACFTVLLSFQRRTAGHIETHLTLATGATRNTQFI